MIGRLSGIGKTEMELCETDEKIFAIVKEKLLIFPMIRLTIENPIAIVVQISVISVRIDVIAEKIFRIAGEIGVAIKGIFRTTRITDATTETASGATVVTETITEEISGVSGDSGEIIKRISDPIEKRKGITNDIIPHGQIIASDILPSTTGINIQRDCTEEDAGVSLKDVRFLSVKKSGNLTQGKEGAGLDL